MPHQDAQGRWMSDDGLQYWDGTSWRPVGVAAQQGRRSVALPAVLIGCGFALVIGLVLVIGGIFMVQSSSFQSGFCETWNNNPSEAGTPCPFHPSP
jgi:hypothetical protein